MPNKKYKYINKHILNMANHIARDVLKYNRCVYQEAIDALPDDKFFPIVFAMVHEHKAGKPTEPHMRCIFAVPTDAQRLIIDVEMGVYDMLPEVELPEEKLEEQEEPAKA